MIRNSIFIGAALVVPYATALADVADAGGAATAAVTTVVGEGEVVVTARAQKLYRVEETSAGKLPTEPLASSQSITVITKELIQDQGARDAQDLYRNISGVSVFSYAGVTARGFRQQENFYDGLRGDPYIGFAVPQTFNIERVEFLKGPAGMLYGQTAPGGLFNYVTKRATRTRGGQAAIVGGTMSRYGGQAELNAPVGDVFAVRAGAFYEDRDLPRYGAANESLVLDSGAVLDLGPVKLTGQALRIEQDLAANRLRGVPVTNAGVFLADRRWNHNEPTDFLRLKSTSFQLRADVTLADGLTADAAYRRIDATERQNYHEPTALIDRNADGTPDAVVRQFRNQFRDSGIDSFGANAIWASHWSDRVGNRVLVGTDHSVSGDTLSNQLINGTATAGAGRPCPLDLRNPVYRACNAASYVGAAPAVTGNRATRTGFYALNELTVGPVILTAGIRTDTFKDQSRAANGTVTRFRDSDETYRLGAVWRVRDDVSLFAQYSTSFEPQGVGAQDPRAGGPFAPTTGISYEGGVKTALLDGRIQSTIAFYHIRRKNVLQADPRGDPEGDGISNQVAFGEITSKGLDVDLAADLTRNWVLTLTYAYNDARITQDNGRTAITNSVVGGRFANAPRNKLGFWTRYQLPATGFAFALGGDYVSKRLSLVNQVVRPYFVFDGSVSYETGPWTVRLRADNLFDKTYAASGFTLATGHFPGEPRSAFLEVARRF